MTAKYIQFGCGLCAPNGWRNFDAGPAFWLQKRLPITRQLLLKRGFPDYPVDRIEYGDIIEGLPVKKESAVGVYSSHVLEHLPLEGFRVALRNVYEYLQPGGTFRSVLPDLEYYIGGYVQQADSTAAMKFLNSTHLGEPRVSKGLASLLQLLFGRSKHLWMWDYRAIEAELRAAGFTRIRRAYFGDSDDKHFNEVEERGRWENCLGVECKKPANEKIGPSKQIL